MNDSDQKWYLCNMSSFPSNDSGLSFFDVKVATHFQTEIYRHITIFIPSSLEKHCHNTCMCLTGHFPDTLQFRFRFGLKDRRRSNLWTVPRFFINPCYVDDGFNLASDLNTRWQNIQNEALVTTALSLVTSQQGGADSQFKSRVHGITKWPLKRSKFRRMMG